MTTEQKVTLRGLLNLLGEVSPLDEQFAADLEEIQAAQPLAGAIAPVAQNRTDSAQPSE